MGSLLPQMSAGVVLVAAAMAFWGFANRDTCDPSKQQCTSNHLPPTGDPYAILGVKKSSTKDTVQKAYRRLAKKWHPDKNRGVKDVEAIFARIGHAYNVLMDPEMREVLDRLGEAGLERFTNGDPTVKKDYMPPDEVLRKINLEFDGDEPLLHWLVTTGFALLDSFDPSRLRFIPVMLGLMTDLPSVVITATSDATGQALQPGASTTSAVTFKFVLSGKSADFTASSIQHNCGKKAKFLGIKTTFYLQCGHKPGRELSVSVNARAFTVHNHREYNTASNVFNVTMV